MNRVRRLIPVLIAQLALVQAVKAQKPPEATAGSIASLSAEQDRQAALPRNIAWNPSGSLFSFIRTTPAAGKSSRKAPTSEIYAVDTGTGQQKTLVSAADLTAAFGREARSLPGEEDEDEAAKKGLQNYAWAPDGHDLLLATGKSLAWFNLDTHTSRSLLSEKPLSDPRISPDGRDVSFIHEHTLWLLNVATGSARALTRSGSNDLREGEPDWLYSNELHMRPAYWWAPDSASIAWIETDDHAVAKYNLRRSNGEEQSIAFPKPGESIPSVRLFVSSISGGAARPIDLGKDRNVYIPLVHWLPDGKHLAIERLSRNQKTLDLLIADSTTGTSHVILTDTDAYWINLHDDLHFLKDSRRFLWSSERTGFRHLYLYDIAGRQLAQLTHGDWEVTSVAGVDEAAGAVFFTSTEASPMERQLCRVDLSGTGVTRLTQQKGTHDATLAPTGADFLDRFSNRTTPTQLNLLRADGSKITTIGDSSPHDPPASQLSPIEFLTVKTHLNADLNALLIKPPDFDPARRYPIIFYVAGGPGEQIVRDAWGGDVFLWLSLMAQKGYVIFALDNHGTAGRGHLFEEPVHLRFSSQEMADVRDGVLYMHTLSWVDTSRIGIFGFGFGGFLTLHGMLDRPLLFKAGFAGEPIADWHFYDAFFSERYLEDPVRNQDGWLASSPIENAKNLGAPLLITQATLDEKVHIENSLSLLDELLDNRKYADILLFPDRKTPFDDQGARLVLFQRLTDFFLKNL
jgi:dipeptidyl-peptidase-4